MRLGTRVAWLTALHWVVDALLGSALLVGAELAIATFAGWTEFVGPWELRAGLARLSPLAWLSIVPAALVGAAVLALGTAQKRGSDALAAGIAAVGAGAVAVGVSQGRHFAVLPWRLAFVAVLAGGAFAVVFLGLGCCVRVLDRAPVAAALGALALAAGLEIANVRVLPRLYPAFHAGLLAFAAASSPVWGRVLPMDDPRRRARAPLTLRLLALLLPLWALAHATANARALALVDNLRFIYMHRSPAMGLGVELAARLAPPPPLEAAVVEAPRPDDRLNLDWRERDILLISVDALRADHVGAYGYARPTTPHFDALARQGTMFVRAYCPTPHTSYSVTSMMTGKNLRPLLLQGLGSDSDTAAGLLRTYGYRTAAFYPPAVFFIDEEAFVRYRDRRLDFEYARIEFAVPAERAAALRQYVATQAAGRKLFVWVHLFEPHEPYVAHPEHPFGERDVDRYDSEIAAADDGIGEIVAVMRSRRPQAVVIVTADHGEEFGDHQGRYHGTTVYEEQVRVPLVISAPGVAQGRRIEAPVQTIDLLPTVLAALDIPRPPRIRGNELSRWLKAEAPPPSAPTDDPDATADAPRTPAAFAETDDQTLLADAAWRLICARRVGACALYDLSRDPDEQRDVSVLHAARFAAMRATLARLQASHGTYETAPGARPWPDALRRGLSGDVDAAADVAALLDDSDVVFRRKAAEVLFGLRSQVAAPQLRLSLARDDDDVVRRWSALALTRMGERVPRAIELLDDRDPTFKRFAALALAESGDDRGSAILVGWWREGPPPFARARELLAALAKVRAKDAAPALVGALEDVRLRPYVATTLGALGQRSARAPLASYWARERFQTSRVAIGDALVELGAKRELVVPLVRFLGTPDPLPNGLALAARAGILEQVGGASTLQLAELHAAEIDRAVRLRLRVPAGGNRSGLRVIARGRATGDDPGEVWVRVGPEHALTLSFAGREPGERFATLPVDGEVGAGATVELDVTVRAGALVDSVAVVPLADELPAPAPTPWTAPEAESPSSPSPGR